jgi:hypothetical protein
VDATSLVSSCPRVDDADKRTEVNRSMLILRAYVPGPEIVVDMRADEVQELLHSLFQGATVVLEYPAVAVVGGFVCAGQKKSEW